MNSFTACADAFKMVLKQAGNKRVADNITPTVDQWRRHRRELNRHGRQTALVGRHVGAEASAVVGGVARAAESHRGDGRAGGGDGLDGEVVRCRRAFDGFPMVFTMPARI